jgi:hypothetical protein
MKAIGRRHHLHRHSLSFRSAAPSPADSPSSRTRAVVTQRQPTMRRLHVVAAVELLIEGDLALRFIGFADLADAFFAADEPFFDHQRAVAFTAFQLSALA